MKKVSSLLLLCIFLFSACKNKVKEAAADKEMYQKATETLLEKEKKNPLAFLNVSSYNKHNLIGQTVIKATVNNTAKICTYKDVQLELSFFSKTGALLEKDLETVYDLVAPGKSVIFKTKYFAPKGSDNVNIKILNAKLNE